MVQGIGLAVFDLVFQELGRTGVSGKPKLCASLLLCMALNPKPFIQNAKP